MSVIYSGWLSSRFALSPSSRFGHACSLLALLLLLPVLAGCSLETFRASGPRPPRLLHIAAIFPASGVDGSLGRALRRGVDLAVWQHTRIARGYRLTVTSIDEAPGASATDVSNLLRKRHVLAVVGPLDSSTARALLPFAERRRIPIISPAGMPNVPSSTAATRIGALITLFHPPETDGAAGRAAADLAVAPVPGLAAQSVFIVDDGSPSGRIASTSFTGELERKGGIVAGTRSITPTIPSNVQHVVSAIIEANPALVFYAGNTAAGADLRRTLSLTGAPQLRLLTVGAIADNSGWGSAVGTRAAAAYTLGLLAAPDLSTLPRAKHFRAMYHRAFPGQVLLPQSALAYDAAMDEIAAMQRLIRQGRPITRASIRSIIASTRYRGITGPLAFNRDGAGVAHTGFGLYMCDIKGAWHYSRKVE